LLIALIQSLRPKQWTKNGLLFAGYLFTIQQGHSVGELLRVAAAFGIFCGVCGATYIINDTVDAEADRKHPRKCKRPIASGAVPIPVALVFACLLLAGGVWGAFRLNLPFGVLTIAYLVLTLSYSAFLKHHVIIDVLVIAALFVIRAVAGAKVISVPISSWLLLCTTLLALFLGLAKRRSELMSLQDGGLGHRKTLGEYTAPMLDQMLSVTASATLMAYCLYTFTSVSVATGKPHPAMMVTIPFVVYGLFRYMFLIHSRNVGGSPEQVLLEDKPMLLNLLLYVVAAIAALKLLAP
jgi:4-hydroxybenzoate polyprenyltransferase